MRIRSTAFVAFIFFPLAPAVASAQMEPAPSLAGQESRVGPDVEVTLTGDWEVGDTYRVEHVKERKETRNGAAQPVRSSNGITEVKVAEKTDSGYVLVSTLIEADLSNYTTGRGAAEAATALTRLFQDKSMEIVTNEAGFPTGLRNAEEVVDLMREAMDQVVDLMAKDPQQKDQVEAMLESMMTPRTIEAMALKDALVFYGLMGGSYSGGTTEVYSGTMLFPFTQSPIEARLYVLLRDIDEEKGQIHIATQSVPDSEELKQATTAWMTRMLQAQGQTVPDELPIPTIRMQDSLEYVYDRERTLTQRVTFQRFLGIGDANKRLDFETFRLIPG